MSDGRQWTGELASKKRFGIFRKTAFLNRVGFQKRSQWERTARPRRNLSARRGPRFSSRHGTSSGLTIVQQRIHAQSGLAWTLVRRLPSFFQKFRMTTSSSRQASTPTHRSNLYPALAWSKNRGRFPSIFTLKMNLLTGISPPRPHPSDWMILQFHPWITQAKRLPWEKRRFHIPVTAPTPPSATNSRRLRSWPTDP